jgi:hypothetical protein
MKTIYRILITAVVITLVFASCDDSYGPRKESVPQFISASATPGTFNFGDTITLSVNIIDPATNLSTLFYEVIDNGKVITTGSVPLNGDSAELDFPIYMPLIKDQSDNAPIRINLIAQNVLKGVSHHVVEGITGKRPEYERLYLVTDNGTVVPLESSDADKNRFEATELTLDPTFRYKIAHKLHSDNSIDYSGHVYGNVGGRIGMIGENGESAFAYMPDVEYTKTFTFYNVPLFTTMVGDNLGADDLALSSFGSENIDNEAFRTITRTLEQGKSYTLFGVLGDSENIYNVDFFERESDSKVKFLGNTGEYTIYFNPVRKNIFVGLDNPSYPDYLLASGWGLGYPTNATTAEIGAVYSGRNRTHTSWGFDNVLNYVLLRKTSDNIYQGTFYTPGEHDHYAGFKLFENTGWGNEKKAGDFTFTGEQIISGDNDWTVSNSEGDPIIESANYRFTVNLNNNTVHIEKITLN